MDLMSVHPGQHVYRIHLAGLPWVGERLVSRARLPVPATGLRSRLGPWTLPLPRRLYVFTPLACPSPSDAIHLPASSDIGDEGRASSPRSLGFKGVESKSQHIWAGAARFPVQPKRMRHVTLSSLLYDDRSSNLFDE